METFCDRVLGVAMILSISKHLFLDENRKE
jgi:hypothetical protein